MGLSKSSMGLNAVDDGLSIKKRREQDRVVALMGNPNVGKSTVFNALTNMHQHTGNWPGKTVATAQGYCRFNDRGYVMVDLPGCYSLQAHSAEEEVARDFLCFGGADCAVVVCDATCLERNLNLVLQVLEITDRAVLCVNLLDEAEHKGIELDLCELSNLLAVPVVGASAREGRGLSELMEAVEAVCGGEAPKREFPLTRYTKPAEDLLERLMPAARRMAGDKVSARWLGVKLLDTVDMSLKKSLTQQLGEDPYEDAQVREVLDGEDISGLKDEMSAAVVNLAERIYMAVKRSSAGGYSSRDRKIDRILTSPLTGFPIMLILLLVVFWLTVAGANYPSRLLSEGLFALGDWLRGACVGLGVPGWLTGLLFDGVYKTLSWVVAVMLPPMAIFFPIFTLLEDLGYLPRVAFNLDRCFRSCGACGKQALTSCMAYIILHYKRQEKETLSPSILMLAISELSSARRWGRSP